MSEQGFASTVSGYVKGGTWGTEGDVTSGGVNLFASSLVPSGGYANIESADWGQDPLDSNNSRGTATFDVNGSADMTFGQAWLGWAAAVLGAESTPAETTVGQSDYLSNIDYAASTRGLFYTMGYTMETDRVMVAPSVKIVGVTITCNLNDKGTITFQGIADDVRESSANTAAELTALTDYFYETVSFGGSDDYFRIKDYSTGVSLSSTHDKEILGFTINLSRPHNRKYGLRGASSRFTKEPVQPGKFKASLTVRHSELDNAGYDIFGDYSNPGFRMAEIYIAGSPIGTGVKRSLKFQFPCLKVQGQFPEGHAPTSNSGNYQPGITYDCLRTTTAPSGMTGVTKAVRIAAISEGRSAKWAT